MKARMDALCRGDGILYLHATVTDTDSVEGIEASAATEGGSPLPCNWYHLESANRKHRIAIAVPLLASGTVEVALTAPDGSPCANGHAALPDQRAKWESRLTYRFKPNIAAQIRDIDERNMQQGIYVTFEYILPDLGDSYVHAKLTLPYHEDSDIHATLLDAAGQPTGASIIDMGDIVQPSTFDPAMLLRTRTVSFRIPKDSPGFTLAARDDAHPELTGFRSALPHHIGELQGKGTRYWLTAGIDPEYDHLFRTHRTPANVLAMQRAATFSHAYRFSIVVPLFRTPIAFFNDMLDSVLQQTYSNWELVLVNASPEDERLSAAVTEAAARDERVRFTTLKQNLGITENTNYGIMAATGDFVCFFDHDDVIEPDLLFEYARALEDDPAIDLLYCDEDKMDENGSRFYDAFFKTDFDLELLRCNNYVCHLLCVRKSILDEIEPPSAKYDGAQDHNLTLRVAERTSRIHHVPKMLYHWRATSASTAANPGEGADKIKPYAITAGQLAISEHLERQGIRAHLEEGPAPFTHHVVYEIAGEPLVSIVIPNKDCADYLERCVGSILDKTAYTNYEIVIVDNNSTDPQTPDCYRQLEQHDARIRTVTWPGAFNFSQIVNFGAAQARGDYLLFLNNDTEVLTEEWLGTMLGLCQQEAVGAVGAYLMYPDGTTQHAGIIIPGETDYALHELVCAPTGNKGYFCRGGMTHNCIAVTGACMMTPRAAFDAVGGFEEKLSVAYNDVDFCLKLRDAGYKVLYEPAAQLIHYESVSRGMDYADTDKRARMLEEASLLKARWAKVYVEGDPFFNPNMTDLYRLAWR